MRAAYTGAGEKATRITKLETEGVSSTCQNLVTSSSLIGDAFASTEYRAHLIDVMAARALARGLSVDRAGAARYTGEARPYKSLPAK